tara:strand:+ start:108 stop:887 length:780 start_codon:yes stop_codon:yes gene_type:complete
MKNTNYIKSIRAKKRYHSNNFIFEKVSKTMMDSIDLIKNEFNNILEIGINEESSFEHLFSKYKKAKFSRLDISRNRFNGDKRFNFLCDDIDEWKITKNNYDLIYSNCYSFITNNFFETLENMKKSLKVNGFLLIAIPDKNNLYQIYNSMIKADLENYNGMFRRFNPTFEIEDILANLKKLSFDSPIINTDRFIIEYKEFDNLLNDLRSMNLSYLQNDKRYKFENKNYFKSVNKYYKKDYYFNGYYPIEFTINIISAWKI